MMGSRDGEAMKITNEHQHVPISVPDGRTVEGIVHVRGIDLRVHGRGVVFERRTPVAAVMRTHHALRRLAIEDQRHGPTWLMALAAPVAAFAVAAIFTGSKEGRR
jgi:hypothetical protein